MQYNLKTRLPLKKLCEYRDPINAKRLYSVRLVRRGLTLRAKGNENQAEDPAPFAQIANAVPTLYMKLRPKFIE